jgi:phytoene dehydrogenase-like protein
VPALYSLMSHLDLVDGVQYPRGGMYTVIEAIERLAVAAGVQIRTGADVTAIEVDPASADVRHPRRTGTARGVRLADGEVVPADVVVSGADLFHTETALLAEPHRTLPEPWWEDRGPGISSLLVMAGVRGALPELAHHSLFFTRDWPGNFDAILGAGRSTPPQELRIPGEASLYVARTTATDPTATSTRWAGGRASRTCAPAWSPGTWWARRTSPATSPPGAAPPSAWSTPWRRARCSVPATDRPGCPTCCTSARAPCPGSACRCA